MLTSQGDTILEFLQLPKELTIKLSNFIKMRDIQKIRNSLSHNGMDTCFGEIIAYLEA